jgi:3-methyladenine DNA glycosylase AlkC
MDNPKALKHLLNVDVVKKISMALKRSYSSFNQKKFESFTDELQQLELKERVLLITRHLKENLPSDYTKALVILIDSMEEGDLKGFELWPYSEYISQFGLDHFDESMKAMYILTQRFTSEFAVRNFVIKDHKRVLKYFNKWINDKNVHVRRWISEGTRPLLPWAQKIPLFVMDPLHTLLLLDKLKFDPDLYVRKSVANHLNDISKNHPQVVIEMLRLWRKDVPSEHEEKLNWITRHSLRTLIKKGEPASFKLLGVNNNPEIKVTKLVLNQKKFRLHETLAFSFEVESLRKQKLIIDYSLGFQKANGKMVDKVFKLKTVEMEDGDKARLSKKHSLKPITTMKYYSGVHALKIQINGIVVKELEFDFEVWPKKGDHEGPLPD